MYTLLNADQIARRVLELGDVITEEYRNRELTIVGVLNGSLIFVADLMRSIRIPHRVGFVQASSYRGPTTESGSLWVGMEMIPEISGRHVLLVDDIFDTGRTISRLLVELQQFQPASIRTAVLLWKDGRSEVQIAPEFHGFKIPNQFVVGYGLDFNDDYRHFPEIAVLEESDVTPNDEE